MAVSLTSFATFSGKILGSGPILLSPDFTVRAFLLVTLAQADQSPARKMGEVLMLNYLLLASAALSFAAPASAAT
jgi:hypothetical protein